MPTDPSLPLVERRCVSAEIELRADGDEPAGRKQVVGYASVFDSPTERGSDFREVIRPGAFTRTLQENPDVRALWNHNLDLILGRTKAKTLSVAEDEKGLRFELDLPDSPTGQDARSAIERGDVDAMSFGFIVRVDTMTKGEDGKILREVLDVDLLEISPVIFPAYQETSAELRAKIDEFKASGSEGWSVIHRNELRKLELHYRE